MKKIIWLFTALLPIVFVFSCQKQIAADDTATGGRNPSMRASDPVTPISVSYSGNNATICYTLPCGKGKILFSYDNGATWESNGSQDFMFPNANGKICRTIDISSAGACNSNTSIKVKLFFSPGQGNEGNKCPSGSYNGGDVATSLTCVSPAPSGCAEPFSLTATTPIVTDLNNGFAAITISYIVTSCNFNGIIKTQGGATAGGDDGATMGAYTNGDALNTCSGLSSTHYLTGPTNPLQTNPQTYPHMTNKNIVYSWTDNFIPGQCRTYTFTYTRALSGQDLVTGQWSAKAADGSYEDFQAPLAASN